MAKQIQINPVYTIARSYAQKLNHERCGGQRFETSDFFSSHSFSFFYDPSEDEIELMTAKLYNWAKRDVEEEVAMKKAELQKPNERKNKIKDTAEGQAATDFADDAASGDILP